MASFNYGIDCEDDKKAKKLWQFISRLNIAQDGLDLSEERVSVIAGQALLEELKGYASAQPGDLVAEVWPADRDYDDAESGGALEVYSIKGKPTRAKAASGPTRFKAYAGSQGNCQAFRAWLDTTPPPGLEILEQWEPAIEGGSWGIDFRCDDPNFAKSANTQWGAKGIVLEKVRR